MRDLIKFRKIHRLILVPFLLSNIICSLSLSSSALNPTPLCLPNDKSALLQFKNTISIDDSFSDITYYPKTNSWNENTDCCSWEGVSCDKATGQVIGLDLSCSLLVGSLPPNTTLFHLEGLKRLNLAHNNFNDSSIPFGLSQLVSLKDLNLSFSSFSGLIPSDISFLTKLTSLDLSENDQSFDSHSFEKLTRNLSELENLFLDSVNMSDVVPTSFKNLSSSLKQLSLSGCQLQGEFPSEIIQLPYLEYLDLSSNSVTGYLPNSNWSSEIRLLDLSFTDVRGSIPASLANLTKITSLLLYASNFEGQIPDVFGNLNGLTTLHFFGCNFSGQIPPSIFNLTQLTYLELSSNRLEGPLPTHVTGLQNLNEFHSTDNLLTGPIPSWPFTLPSLEYLDLSNNGLTGPINHIQKPNSIRHVYLPNNDIHGEIPSSFFGLVKLTELDLSSNNLSGVIKSDMISKLDSLEILDLSSNNFSGVNKFDVLSKLTNLTVVNLSNNKLLSLGSDNGVNSTFQKLTILSLSSCNLRQFPSFLRSAKSLSSLDISHNKIQGPIFETETEGWELLSTLDLSHNLLTSLEQFPGKNLNTLDLHSNLLQGPLLVPSPTVREFLISENKLTGEIPPSVCNLTSLRILDLSKNYLEGIIPPCLGNFSHEIYIINLQRNNFHGKIPDFVDGRYGIFTSLALNDNQLEGSLPRSLVNCSSLAFLNLANNRFNDHFPHWLGVLPNLQVLILRSNRFHGSLDNFTVTSFFSRLQVIDLSGNEFTGSLPPKFFRSLRALEIANYHLPPTHKSCATLIYPRHCQWSAVDEYKNFVEVTMKRLEIDLDLDKSLTGFTLVDFSNNRFNGQIPEVLGELLALLVLNLSHNSLTGPLPPSLASIAALESLDLSSNKLGGGIPSELTKLTFLAVLNLSQNNFVGPIPVGNQFNTFDNGSYSGNLDLCGFPLSKKCGNNEEPKSPTSMVVEGEGSAIPFIWKLVMMGYSCGVVLGLSTGYFVFTTGRPWWFVRMVERDWQRNFTRWIRKIGRKRN
ncbi:receptor-like protein 6 [Gossypium hirsutum]|uniref:Receptor-like protein 6 n=1 Tax=Gossypium hirsutum TaxID=3635 RepID=A0ABM2YND9_GOSHI|nr:receptor-like protein 6 [Gossypium hirsutum]